MPVDFKGKAYSTVTERLDRMHKDTKGKYDLFTEVIGDVSDTVLMKATLVITKGASTKVDNIHTYVGHAFERANSSFINKTSHVENCETSAIGRALASAGYAGGEFCSADELVTAVSNQGGTNTTSTTSTKPSNGAYTTGKYSEKQVKYIDSLLEQIDDKKLATQVHGEINRKVLNASATIDRLKQILANPAN